MTTTAQPPALTLVIANKAYSSWSMRPWILMKTLGLAFDEIVIPLQREDTRAAILRYSPSGKVPAIVAGEETVWDSLAIFERLAEWFPQAGVWPREARARSLARAVSAEMHSSFQALRTQYPMNVRRAPKALAPTPETLADIARIEAIWAMARARWGGSGPFLFGEFSAADAMYAPVVSRLESYAAPVSAAARDYMAAVQALPAWAEWRQGAEAESWRIEKYDSI